MIYAQKYIVKGLESCHNCLISLLKKLVILKVFYKIISDFKVMHNFINKNITCLFDLNMKILDIIHSVQLSLNKTAVLVRRCLAG